jgi:hypothetical protein
VLPELMQTGPKKKKKKKVFILPSLVNKYNLFAVYAGNI